MSAEGPRFNAVLVSIIPQGESDALVRFFAEGPGALVTRARGLRKPASKLAPRLKPADELEIRLASGRGGMFMLIGAAAGHQHPGWRDDLSLLALYWFMAECLYVGSADEQVNADMYRLLCNLLRSSPAAEERGGAAGVFCLKLLNLHGLLADLAHCALDGHALTADEPVHLLPRAEGVVGRQAYNQQYARSGGGMVRLEPARRLRWQQLLRGALLDYPAAQADERDAALLAQLTARALGSTAATSVRSLSFLLEQWQLPTLEDLLIDQLQQPW